MTNKTSYMKTSIKTGVVILLFFFAGCTGFKQQSVFKEKTINLATLQKITQNQYNRIQSLDGWATMTVQSPMQGYNASAHILMKKPDSLFFKIEATFGIDVGMLFADRSRYMIYSPMQNLSYSGHIDSLHKAPFLDMDITFDQLLQTVTGSELLTSLQDWNVTKTEDDIRLSGKYRDDVYLYHFHPVFGNITQLEIVNKDRQTVALHKFSNFKSVNGTRIPFHISINRPLEKQGLSLFYERMKINKSIDKNEFHIKLPDNVLKVNL